MCCSSTAAGWLESVGPSSSTNFVDGEGDNEHDSFENRRKGGRSKASMQGMSVGNSRVQNPKDGRFTIARMLRGTRRRHVGKVYRFEVP